jgi:endonuclease III-like uncharacterized protein
MSSNKEFLDLLNSVVEEQKFTETLTDGEEYSFRLLKTLQLKELIKSVVDSPITQAVFNTTLSKLFRDSLVDKTTKQFNTIDRILFYLGTRINAISDEYTVVVNDDTKETKVTKISEHKKKLLASSLKADLFNDKTHTEDSITVVFGIPSLETEDKLNKEIYSKAKLELEKQEDFRELIGDIFINELAKCIKVLKIQDKELDLTTLSFSERLKIVERLPAQTISATLSFVETYKKVIKEALTVVDEVVIPIDGSLFSLR